MNSELRVIGLMFIVLLLAACSKDGDSPENAQPVINVYVYSPEHPMITRGDIGNVAAIDNTLNESLIKTLQIWVFEHGTENLVSYYKPGTVNNLNDNKGVTYQLNVSETFAKAKPKPTVDVYVVANVTSENCGLSLGDQTTRATLESALIGSNYFGLSPLISSVPDGPNGGLPMSGVLRDVAVTGSAPVFKISSVKLKRTVSKLRFIFSRDEGEKVIITGIKLGVDLVNHTIPLIPTAEYLFTNANNGLYNISDTYVSPADGGTELLPSNSSLRTDGINSNEDPLKYTYQSGQDAQNYEDLIAAGVSAGKLSDVGPYYLRETDKKLSGVITYQIGDNTTDKKAKFEMKNAGDFSRNHTWIVYAYYGVDGMKVESVFSQEWNEVKTEDVHNWYNW